MNTKDKPRGFFAENFRTGEKRGFNGMVLDTLSAEDRVELRLIDLTQQHIDEGIAIVHAWVAENWGEEVETRDFDVWYE